MDATRAIADGDAGARPWRAPAGGGLRRCSRKASAERTRVSTRAVRVAGRLGPIRKSPAADSVIPLNGPPVFC